MQKNEIWEILGIAPTDDVELIKEAYRSQLLNTNPEDDQEGFMRLKEAFDEAVRSVNEGEEEEQEQPYAEIIEKVDSIYQDIDKRVDIQNWNELFSDEIFSELDQQDDIRNAFLGYVMDHCLFPSNIFKKFDEVFSITADQEALSEKFPPAYILFLINNIKADDGVIFSEKILKGRNECDKEAEEVKIESDYELETHDNFEYEIDNYISEVKKLTNYYRRIDDESLAEEKEQREELIDALGSEILYLRSMNYHHPAEVIAVTRYLYYKERYDECFNILKKKFDEIVNKGVKHSDYFVSHIIFMYLRFMLLDIHKDMNISISDEELNKCDELISKKLDEKFNEETHPARGLILYLQGDKKKASDYLSYSCNYIRDNNSYNLILKQIDRERIAELEEQYDNKTISNRSLISLAWLYLRNDERHKAENILGEIKDGDPESIFEYDYLIGWFNMTGQDNENSLPHLIKWNQILVDKYGLEQPEDINKYTIEEIRDIQRIPYSFYLISYLYAMIEDTESAKENCKKALKNAHPKDFYQYARLYHAILNEREEFEELFDFWSSEVDRVDNYDYSLMARGFRQFAAYKIFNARTILDDYYYLREADPTYIDSYLYAQEVYLAYNDSKGMEESFEYLEHYNIDDIRIDLNKARYYKQIKNIEEAIPLFEKVEDAINNGYDGISEIHKFYIAYVYALMDLEGMNKPDVDQEELVKRIKNLVERAKQDCEENINIHWIEVDYCEKYEDKADGAYASLHEAFPNYAKRYVEFGKYLNKNDREDEAIAEFEKALEIDPDNLDGLYWLARLYNNYLYIDKEMNEYHDKAEALSLRLNELEKEEYNALQLVLIYYDGMKYDKGLEFADKAVVDFPEAPFIHNPRGIICMNMDNYEEAEKSLKKAIEVFNNPNARRFVAYSNLAKLYSIQRRFKEAADIHKEYIDRFNIDEEYYYDSLADYYDDANMFDEAIECREKAFICGLREITGTDVSESDLSVIKAINDNPDIPVYRFADILETERKYASSFLFKNDYDKLTEIEKDFDAYTEKAGLFKSVDENAKENIKSLRNALWEIGYYYLFTKKDPEKCIKYFEQFLKVFMCEENKDKQFYDKLFRTNEILARNYTVIHDVDNAKKYSENALKTIEKQYGSVEKYLDFTRLTPFRLCAVSGIYFYMGKRDEFRKYLDMIDLAPRCHHCPHSSCIDKNDKLALVAELDGDYQKALELFRNGNELGGNDTERATGIRECLRVLG